MKIQSIKECKQCDLCKNQAPLLDNYKKVDVMWVGLSAKKVIDLQDDFPLKNDTNSGKLIEKIEKENSQFTYYKTNLVKCLPLGENQKLRYPTVQEMTSCFPNLLKEIELVKPKVVVLLGGVVAKFVMKNMSSNESGQSFQLITIEHPSYISVYRRKFEQTYIDKVSNRLRSILK